VKKVLIFNAIAEAATGLALLVVPSLVGQLLLGEGLTGVAPDPRIVEELWARHRARQDGDIHNAGKRVA